VLGLVLLIVVCFQDGWTSVEAASTRDSSDQNLPPVTAIESAKDDSDSTRSANDAPIKPDGPITASLKPSQFKLPLRFEANEGQTDSTVKFLSRGIGHSLFLTPSEAVFVLRRRNAPASAISQTRDTDFQRQEAQPDTLVRMKLIGQKPDTQIVGVEQTSGKSNYLIGGDKTKWKSNIPHYARVKYEEVYPGIDLVFYGSQQQVEFDFVVAAGADPTVIKLAFEGAKKVEVDTVGDLLLRTVEGTVTLRKPRVYQEIDGFKKIVGGSYELLESAEHGAAPLMENFDVKTHVVGLKLDPYDTRGTLVIDPIILLYSTYLGGSLYDGGEFPGTTIAVDALGNAYVTGQTGSTDFPTTPGAYQTSFGGSSDAFVAKLNPTGSDLVYSTYLGGSGSDVPFKIAVDSSGYAYLTGWTYSSDFPARNAISEYMGNGDAFVAKLNPTGSDLVYSTYLGGTGGEIGYGIAVDDSGNAYVTGGTDSADFPLNNPLQAFGGWEDAFVTKLNPTGELVYSSYLGGTGGDTGRAIAVDAEGNAYVTGETYSIDFPTRNPVQAIKKGLRDAFVTKLNAAGSAFIYSTYLGGHDTENAYAIAVDADSNAYVAGSTRSDDFPVTPGAFQSYLAGCGAFYCDVFVTKFNRNGSRFMYSTYLGGTHGEHATAIAVDGAGNAWITGASNSFDYPITFDAFDPTCGVDGFCVPCTLDCLEPASNFTFVTKLNDQGSALGFSTYLDGGAGNGIAIDVQGHVYVSGWAPSNDFPSVNAFQPANAGWGDGFVTKLAEIADGPIISVSPALHDFGGVGSGSWADKKFTVRNVGGGLLNGNATTSAMWACDPMSPAGCGQAVNAPRFSIVSGDSFSLAPGASQDIVVRFAPTEQLLYFGAVYFSSDGGDFWLNMRGRSFFTLSVAAAGNGYGYITISPPGTTCPPMCAPTLDAGTIVTLTAVPYPGSVFAGWGEGGSNKDCLDGKVTMDADKFCLATFNVASPLTVGSPRLAEAEVGVAYNSSLDIRGGIAPYTVNVVRGTIPPGITLNPEGSLSGKPTQAGVRGVTVKVTDQRHNSVSKTLNIRVLNSVNIATEALPEGRVGKKYTARLKLSGGKSAYKWSLVGGNLPRGLAFNSSTGRISGLPAEAGKFSVVFQLTDPLGGSAHKNFILTIE